MSKFQVLFRLAVLSVACWLFTGCSPYNKTRMQSGSLAFLKNQQNVNVEYRYDDLRVGVYKKKSVPEQEYIARKVAEVEEKHPGTGEAWRQTWMQDRPTRFQPKFEELLNKQMEDRSQSLRFGHYPDAPYTLVLHSLFLDPGWNAAIMMRPGLLTADANFVETQSHANTVASVRLENMTGMDAWGMAFDPDWRMQETYAKAGKELGILIYKKIR